MHGVGYDYDPEQYTFAPGVEAKAPEVAKIEVVCRDDDADRLLRTVTPIERAVKIRNGAEGTAALQS